MILTKRFNPRSRAGSDAHPISFCRLVPRFNPRSRAGSDFIYLRVFHLFVCFNPRSRAGSDVAEHPLGDDLQGFNPRSRAGSDYRALDGFARYVSFNPRSRAGSDFFKSSSPNSQIRFQSTLPRGERRQERRRNVPCTRVSIHAPARGATNGTHKFAPHILFQSTLPRGERL